MLRLIAVTHQEWLQWIADGYLQCGDRVRLVSDRDSEEPLRTLLSCAPAFSLRDDQAIIFAHLIDGDGEPSNEAATTLKLEFVREFFPLNERGAQLIEGDARRASVRLGRPHLSQAFDKWRDSALSFAAHHAGLRFAQSAGFSADDSKQLQILQPTAVDTWKPKGFAKFEKRRSCRSFGCRIALAILEAQVDKETWDQIKVRWGTPSFPQEADGAAGGSRSVCDWPWLRNQAQTVREYLCGVGKPFALVQQAALAFWRDRLESQDGTGLERQDELDALARDLRIIEADEGIERAVEAAYLLGRIARRDTVNQLYYATHYNDFPSLCVTPRRGWLGERVPGILELNPRGVEPADQASTTAGLESINGPRSAASNAQVQDQQSEDGPTTEDAVGPASKQVLTPALTQSSTESSPAGQSKVQSSVGEVPLDNSCNTPCTSRQAEQDDSVLPYESGLAQTEPAIATESDAAADVGNVGGYAEGSNSAISTPHGGSTASEAANS